VAVDRGLRCVDGDMEAEILAEGTLGFEARGARADETGVVGSGHRDIDVEIGLAPR
jgi:hypothetical protein